MKKRKGLTQLQIIALGFFLIIITGTILLMLPFSTKEGNTSLLDAAFTAVSSSCVTGLVVKDTYTHWTLFGQLVILALIQVGGLGFASIGIAFSLAFRKQVSLKDRAILQESISSLQLAGGVKLVKLIIKGTILFEILGAVLLAYRFVPEFGFWRGLYFALFISISAFCNGGFDIFGYKEEYSSLVSYAGDSLVILTVTALILIGGIGFIVWEDIYHKKFDYKKYMLHTKLVLLATLVLVVFGTIAFWIIEKDNLLADMSIKDSFLGALFSAVTPRTAGFNSIDTGGLSAAGKMLTVIFMFVGGCPGSTAGGIKTTTLVVLLAYTFSSLKNEKDCNILKRRMGSETIKKACSVLVLNLTLALCGAVIIMTWHPDLAQSDVLFEVFSAIGTAGMSTGITRSLDVVPRIILMFLMYLGRVGSLTFALSFVKSKVDNEIRYPEGKVNVG